MYLYINPIPSVGCDTRSDFKRSKAGFNFEFSFSLTDYINKAEGLSLLYYFLITWKRVDRFMLLFRALVLSENQTAASRI